MGNALDIIHQDHVQLNKLLLILKNIVEQMPESFASDDDKPNLDLLFTIVYYIRTFPDSIHHPKEEKFLFPVLLKRDPTAKEIVARLHADHDEGEQRLQNLSAALERFDRKFPEGVDVLRAETMAYVEFQQEHMSLEEREILPRARKTLTSIDWVRINREFEDGTHPMLGENLETGFRMLFDRIMTGSN